LTKLATITVQGAILALAICSLTLSAAAQTLSGTATNGTTGKPAAGDEVILINLANGMEEAAHTKADSAGKFAFKLTDNGPHLIRAVHQGVTYHAVAPPGMNSVEVQVFDVAKKIASISLTADVLRVEAETGKLQAKRLFVVNNASSPPKTQMNDHNFEFYLPAGAKIDQAQAKAPNGQSIEAEYAPQAEKNRYAVVFPLRPGETQIQVQFSLPYSGTLKFDPKPLYPAEHFVVVLPKSMHFVAADASRFQSMEDPGQADTLVEVAQQTQVGQSLSFTLTGTGTISESPAQVASGAAQQQGRDNRPGGGLGAPIDAPDPLQKYQFLILGGFAVILAVGAWVVLNRQPAGAGTGATSVPVDPLVPSSPPAARSAGTAAATKPVAGASAEHGSALLEALKEEMFQLELERKRGHISQAEYEKTKAALDQTLDRALKRKG